MASPKGTSLQTVRREILFALENWRHQHEAEDLPASTGKDQESHVDLVALAVEFAFS